MDKRRGPRIRSLLQARANFNDGLASVDCLIRNQSSEGMRLAISQAVLLPDQFDLHIPKKGQTRRVRLIWRGADEVGVEFVLDREVKGDAPGDHAPTLGSLAEVDAEVERLEQALRALRSKREAMQAALARDQRVEIDEDTSPGRPPVKRSEPVDVYDEATGDWVRGSLPRTNRYAGPKHG